MDNNMYVELYEQEGMARIIWLEYQDGEGKTISSVPLYACRTVGQAHRRMYALAPPPPEAQSYQLTFGNNGRVVHYGDNLNFIGTNYRGR